MVLNGYKYVQQQHWFIAARSISTSSFMQSSNDVLQEIQKCQQNPYWILLDWTKIVVLKFENMYLMNNITYFSLTGVQVLRTVLNKFSVNNRKNMFVVKELVDSDLVYYLRYVKMVRHTCTIENSRLMANFLIWLLYLITV